MLYAWVWGGEHGEGEWVKATGDSSPVTLRIYDNAKGFLFVRCIKGTTTPNWDVYTDTAGRIYNQSSDVNLVRGQTTYTVGCFSEYATIYLNTGGSSLWNQGGAWFVAWNWSNETDGEWVYLSDSDNDGIFKGNVNPKKKNIKFLRLASGADKNNSANWWNEGNNGYWNQTGDLTIPDGKNQYTITGWGNGDWL